MYAPARLGILALMLDLPESVVLIGMHGIGIRKGLSGIQNEFLLQCH